MTKRLIAAATVCALAVSVIGCGSNSGSVNKIRSYDVEKYVTLGDYDGMEVEVAGDFEVSDEDVVDYINGMLSYYPSYEDTDKQTVEDGDCVNIDYEGKKDGVAFDGGTAQGYVLEIGSGTFIDGFEDGVIGMKTGETKDLNLKFPDSYQSTDLAGKDEGIRQNLSGAGGGRRAVRHRLLVPLLLLRRGPHPRQAQPFP